MLIRLLLAVLTLIGPMPLCACTCAAGHQPEPQANAPVRKSCSCRHHAPTKDTHTRDISGRIAPDECNHTHPPAPHDRGCPAANPRPLVREAISPPTTDAPSDCAHQDTVAWTDLPEINPSAPFSDPPRAAKTPLYLTFLSLRN
jgi:hypothetical protein